MACRLRSRTYLKPSDVSSAKKRLIRVTNQGFTATALYWYWYVSQVSKERKMKNQNNVTKLDRAIEIIVINRYDAQQLQG